MTPREFYDRWYEEARITDSDEDYFLEWLKQQSPDDWHSIISNWNYDSNNAALKWIVSHPMCDIGTAIQLFMIGLDSWDGYKKEDVQSYYHDAFDTFEIARERLKNEDFTNKELIPSVTYSQDDVRRTQLPIIKTYTGLRPANSDFMSQDGTIYLSERAFAMKIGVDYSTIQKLTEKNNSAPQRKPSSKFQVTISIITLLIILLVLVFL
jgi:hypothetical protein